MDFIFNINNAPETPSNNKHLEDILQELELHFQDWNNFYNLYQMCAPPPTKNTEQIQAWFKELQSSFFKIITKYNDKVNKFADIEEISDTDLEDIMQNAVTKASIKPKPQEKEKESNTNTMMYG
tara:strand:+ start:1160 stop:1531 length:372 start_codon:yes stop_codon:yes gene_type:complete